ncbi:uncharacterized protein BDV14DRAFT_168998 [Aspergillus stella-maris]|uniref:uncharacterized protein n=1 Tax=Aspergillus stella-maris TaxID=1810926 RepID=UPI003CCCAF8B
MGEIGEFSKDMRARKRQAKERNPPRRRCHDWMIVSGSCHYAKNRSAFTTYRRVGRQMGGGLSSIYVAGIGTVRLQVRSSAARGAPTRTLELHNVLHTPGTICNGFNSMAWLRSEGGPSTDPYSGTDELDAPFWYSKEFLGLNRLVLAGNPQGESYLPRDTALALSLYIDSMDLKEISTPRPNPPPHPQAPIIMTGLAFLV